MKEFIKLENCLKLTLKIEPKSPLLIMLGKESDDGSANYIPLLTSESNPGTEVTYNKDSEKLDTDNRSGEIYIPGSSIRGLLRSLFNKYRSENSATLFGTLEEEIGRRGRIHTGDAYFFDENKRKKFYDGSKVQEFFRSRSITPIESFTGKVIVPLKFEYTRESFQTEITINNVTVEELTGLYLIMRDSTLGEVRLGASKNRGFGEVEFKVEELVIENFGKRDDFVSHLKGKNFFDTVDNGSIKIGNDYLKEKLVLKKEFKEISNENPNKFILELFSEVSNV